MLFPQPRTNKINNIFKSFTISFTVILEKTIRIPRSLSVKAASVLKGFLNKNPADRLGCHRETGFLDIANHPFFKSIDWEMVSNYCMILPYEVLNYEQVFNAFI